jgi:hypothetical protein
MNDDEKKALKERRKALKAQHVSSNLGDRQYVTTDKLGAPPQLYDEYEGCSKTYLVPRWIFGIIAVCAIIVICLTIYKYTNMTF